MGLITLHKKSSHPDSENRETASLLLPDFFFLNPSCTKEWRSRRWVSLSLCDAAPSLGQKGG